MQCSKAIEDSKMNSPTIRNIKGYFIRLRSLRVSHSMALLLMHEIPFGKSEAIYIPYDALHY